MKAIIKNYLTKVLAIVLTVILAIPNQIFAAAANNYSTESTNQAESIMRTDQDTQSPNIESQAIGGEKTTLVSDITSNEVEDYTIEKSASLSKTTGQIKYKVLIKAKDKSVAIDKVLLTTFGINKNTDLRDLKVDEVKELHTDKSESKIKYKINEPGISDKNDAYETTAISTSNTDHGIAYYVSARLTDQSLANMDEISPLMALDINIKESDTDIYQNRYLLETINIDNDDFNIDKNGEIASLEQSLKEVEDSSSLIKGSYKASDSNILGESPAEIVWTDFVNPKDDKEFTYNINLDQSQDTENSKIKIEFYQATDQGFVLKDKFTNTYNFSDSLNLQIPKGYVGKITINTTPKKDSNPKEFSYNQNKIANPAYKVDTEEEKEESDQDDEEDPSQASPVLMEDADSEDSLLEISDLDQNAQQAGNSSSYNTSYPYSIEYDVTTSVRDGNGNPITSAIPSSGQNPEVWWDITLDTREINNDDLKFDNLYYTLYMGAKDGLNRFKYKVSTSPIAENDTSGFDTADTRSEFLYQGFDNIAKKNLGDQLYIRVKAPLDNDSEVHDQYSLGIRINPDRNYIDNILKEFLAKYKAIPTPFKWKVGDGQADIYRDRPFNLLDERIVASPNFIKYDIDDNFYFDSTRSITADRISDTRVEWNVLDLLRLGEVEDPNIDQASLNPDIDKSDRNKYYYRPNLTGGYNRYSKEEDVKTKNGEFYPGTIVAYNFKDQKGSPYTNYKLDLTLKEKENLFKDQLDNKMNGVKDFTDPVGGSSVSAYTYKYPPAAIDDQYLAYNENPFAIMRINQTFEMVQCFNDGYKDPLSSGNDIIGLQRIEDPEADFLYKMLAGNNADYAKENFKKGAKYNKQNKSDEEALKDALERAYYYTNQVVEEKEKETKHKIPRQVEAFLYQKMVHLITNNKPLYQQYGGYTSVSNQVKNWTNIGTTLTGTDDKDFTGKESGKNRTIPTDERKIQNNDKEALDEAEELANKAKKLLEASYDNGDWNKTKADSVELVFYKHNNKKTIQNLITAKIRKPINAQKISLDDTKLDGAEFTFTSRQTGESVTWTSKENNDDNPLFLKPGQYYVDETKAPKGYSELDTFLIELEEKEVNPDHGPYPQYGLGDIKVNDGYEYKLSILNSDTLKKDDNAVQKDGSGNPLVSVEEDTLNLNIKNEDSNLGKIEFTKTNGKRALDGAEFTLTKITDENKLDSIEKKDEKPVYQKTSTGNKGKFTFGSIPVGTYKLEETKAPTGYQAIEPLILTATINQDEKVTVKFKDETIQESGEIINKAPSTELSFRKIKENEDGEEIVPIDSGTGIFRLYSTSTTDDSDYDRTVSPSSVVVEEDKEKGTPGLQVGEFKFTDLVAGEYILVEEQAPIGFEKPDFPFWSVKVTEKDGELSYEVYKLEKESGKKTKIDETDILVDGQSKGKTFNIENKARTIDHKFKKYLDKKGNKMNAYLRGEDGEKVSFRLYEADYYGLKKDPNDPGKRIVADENGEFNLEGLEYSTYYLLEEENPPKGYAKAAATVLYVQSEAEVQSGKMAVVVRDHTNNTVTGEHNVFDGIVDYRAGEAFGNLLVKKTGESLIENDDSEVGLRRAYFRLYYADEKFNYANDNFQKVASIDKASYIQRVSAGSALTDNEGNPIAKENLPNDQGIVKFENLKPGNYVLIEHRGPAGYEKDPKPRYIKVTESGNVIKSMDKDNASFKEEDIKEETLIDTGNTSFFSRNKSDDDQSNGLMISELPKRLAAQRASSTDRSWENINEFKSVNPYRNQDPMGTDLNQTKITQIDKANKRFKQVFLLKNPKEQTLVANFHWQPLKSIKPMDFDIKVSQVDNDSTFDNLKNLQEIRLKAPKNLPSNQHIRLESTKKIPANATIAIELETSYKASERIGLGVDFFYEHDTADDRGWKKAWATEKYDAASDINTQSNKRTEYVIEEEVEKYDIKEIRTDKLEKGYTQVKQYGKNGKITRKYEVTYVDGKETNRKKVEEEKVDPVNEIILVGTKERQEDIPTGNDKVKVNFLYNNMDDAGNVEESAPERNSGKMSLQIKKGDKFLDIASQSNKDVPTKGSIEFDKLDTKSTYRLVYKRDQVLAERWGLPNTSSYSVDLSDVEKDTFEFTISNGNLLRVFNKDETGFRIPLRISKKDENGSPLTGAQFTAKKIIQGESGKYSNEEFDAVSEATGLSGDNYFRELSPGIYELTETRSPRPKEIENEEDSDYLLPKDKDGNEQKWYFEVKENPDQTNPRKANYMIIDFKFSHTFSKDDAFTEAGNEYNSDDWYGKTIYGTKPVNGEDGKVANEDFMKLIKLVPDDHRSNPARPDAPYKKINDLEVTNVKKTTNFDFIKADDYSRAIEGAEFKLRKLATNDKGEIQKEVLGREYKFAKDENGKDVYNQDATSNTNEGVIFKDIPEGKYLLKETKAPDGYEKLEKPIIVEFKISPTTGRWEQRTVTDEDNGIDSEYYKNIISYKSDNTGISQIKNDKAYTNLEFTKVDQAGNEVKLSAFRLDKLDKNGEVVEDDIYPQTRRNWKSAQFTFDNLTKGKYKLTETNPSSYQRPNPTYFDVVENKETVKLKIKFEEGDPNISFEKDKKGNPTKIKFTNFDKIDFEFTKIGDDKDNPLYGAGFTLKKVLTEKPRQVESGEEGQVIDRSKQIIYTESGKVAEESKELEDYSYFEKANSYSDGKIKFTGLSQGVYELEETNIPNGYQRLNAQRKWIVVVEKNEKGDGLEVKYDYDYEKEYYQKYDSDLFNKYYKDQKQDANILNIDGENSTLVNKSNTTDLNFNKVDRDGKVIAKDAKFTLIKLSHDPNDLENLSTITTYIDYISLREDDGTFNVKGLDRGVYVLSETKAPEGYKKADREFVIQIKEKNDTSEKLVINSYEAKLEYDEKGSEIHKLLGNGEKVEYLDNTKLPMKIKNYEIPNIVFNKVKPAGLIGDNKIKEGKLGITISKYDEKNKKAGNLVDKFTFDLAQTGSINRIDLEDENGKRIYQDGKYIINETKAPQGYVKTDRSYLVKITTKDGVVSAKLLEVQDASGKTITNESGKKVTDTGIDIPDGGLPITATDGDSNFKIVNNNPSLPSTGGSGTFVGFALIGTAIMLAGIAYFAIYQNDKNRPRSNRYNK